MTAASNAVNGHPLRFPSAVTNATTTILLVSSLYFLFFCNIEPVAVSIEFPMQSEAIDGLVQVAAGRWRSAGGGGAMCTAAIHRSPFFFTYSASVMGIH